MKIDYVITRAKAGYTWKVRHHMPDLIHIVQRGTAQTQAMAKTAAEIAVKAYLRFAAEEL